MKKFGIMVGEHYVQSIHGSSFGSIFTVQIGCTCIPTQGNFISCNSYGFAVEVADIIRSLLRIDGRSEKEYPIKIVELKK